MRKTTEYKAENRLTVDIEGLMAMLSCGEVTDKENCRLCRSKSDCWKTLFFITWIR